jgi:membrane-associated phospholipid phosphatase
MPVALALALYFKEDKKAFNSAAFAIVLCFYLSYIGYLLVPAVGPRFTLSTVQTADLLTGPATLWVRQALDGLEHNKTDAFPSGHTAVALVTLVYAWRYREKVLSRILAPAVAALIISTVYLRYHYVIDVIAGVLLAALTVLIAPKTYRIFSGSSERPQG